MHSSLKISCLPIEFVESFNGYEADAADDDYITIEDEDFDMMLSH